jgi:preprotein translocase subunit SecD
VTTSPVAASTAVSNTDLGPLPPGNDPINWTQAQATAAFQTLECGSAAQRQRVADFAATSWALGCGTGYPQDYNKYLLMPAGVKGTSVSSADAAPQTQSTGTGSFATGGWEVDLSFKDNSFYNFTQTTAGGTLQGAIVLDGIVQSAPTNATAIDGNAQITGNFDQSSATALANVLKYGSLPLSFQDNATSETVSPTLGKSSLNAGLLAGAIGLAIVIVYCFFYYRALGIVTIASLAVSGSMVYAAVVLLGQGIDFTLSLSGIAGFIVAVGITADSFVVFYERIKDEIREGKRARSAVESGWRAARRTIVSADAVSILAAVVLYAVSIGDVRGFALTLGLSTVLDLVTVFFFTKPLVTILIQRTLFSSGKYSGLSSQGPQAPLRRRPPGGSGTAPLEAS